MADAVLLYLAMFNVFPAEDLDAGNRNDEKRDGNNASRDRIPQFDVPRKGQEQAKRPDEGDDRQNRLTQMLLDSNKLFQKFFSI